MLLFLSSTGGFQRSRSRGVCRIERGMRTCSGSGWPSMFVLLWLCCGLSSVRNPDEWFRFLDKWLVNLSLNWPFVFTWCILKTRMRDLRPASKKYVTYFSACRKNKLLYKPLTWCLHKMNTYSDGNPLFWKSWLFRGEFDLWLDSPALNASLGSYGVSTSGWLFQLIEKHAFVMCFIWNWPALLYSYWCVSFVPWTFSKGLWMVLVPPLISSEQLWQVCSVESRTVSPWRLFAPVSVCPISRAGVLEFHQGVGAFLLRNAPAPSPTPTQHLDYIRFFFKKMERYISVRRMVPEAEGMGWGMAT